MSPRPGGCGGLGVDQSLVPALEAARQRSERRQELLQLQPGQPNLDDQLAHLFSYSARRRTGPRTPSAAVRGRALDHTPISFGRDLGLGPPSRRPPRCRIGRSPGAADPRYRHAAAGKRTGPPVLGHHTRPHEGRDGLADAGMFCEAGGIRSPIGYALRGASIESPVNRFPRVPPRSSTTPIFSWSPAKSSRRFTGDLRLNDEFACAAIGNPLYGAALGTLEKLGAQGVLERQFCTVAVDQVIQAHVPVERRIIQPREVLVGKGRKWL